MQRLQRSSFVPAPSVLPQPLAHAANSNNHRANEIRHEGWDSCMNRYDTREDVTRTLASGGGGSSRGLGGRRSLLLGLRLRDQPLDHLLLRQTARRYTYASNATRSPHIVSSP